MPTSSEDRNELVVDVGDAEFVDLGPYLLDQLVAARRRHMCF
jgi:hypothetical protein